MFIPFNINPTTIRCRLITYTGQHKHDLPNQQTTNQTPDAYDRDDDRTTRRARAAADRTLDARRTLTLTGRYLDRDGNWKEK
ncbi:unnamed protein product [Rotaria sordida]|uniref:Uncharacterized protein n=1 Tax=Rotaria sordida TaxID=392033 RepID=A0A819TF74_9BILA|nr:unnamed protein product [Rotaria sordida]